MPWLIFALLAVLSLVSLWKPVHIDDANFLVLAEGATQDFWRPHAISINWQGTTEPAFAVLSNPPGIGWWLSVVSGAPVWVQHLWVLLWLPLAVWGAAALGRAYAGRPGLAAVLLVGCPIGLLASHALTPDLPLLACTLGGAGGLVSARPGHRWPWALLMGTAALFRYSGVALIPLAAAWPALHRDHRGVARCAIAAGLPLGGLVLHDLHAYGAVHLLAMVDFQGVSGSARDTGRKLAAALAMLGGAAALPLLALTRLRSAVIGGVLGGVVGAAAAHVSAQQGGAATLGTVLFCAAGGASLLSGLSLRDRHAAWASLWLLGGLVFLLRLRFSAARYWLPFFAPAILIPLREAPLRHVRASAVLTVILSVLLAMDDLELARAQRTLALKVIAAAQTPGWFAGHWGWQHHLTQAGWQPLEEDAPLPPGQVLAASSVSWPQESGPGCRQVVATHAEPDRWPGPRIHTTAGAANIHAFVISASPPVETYAPWGFGADPHDTVTVWQGCP